MLSKNSSIGTERVLDKFKEYRDYKDDYYHNVLYISTLRKFMKLTRLLSFTKVTN